MERALLQQRAEREDAPLDTDGASALSPPAALPEAPPAAQSRGTNARASGYVFSNSELERIWF